MSRAWATGTARSSERQPAPAARVAGDCAAASDAPKPARLRGVFRSIGTVVRHRLSATEASATGGAVWKTFTYRRSEEHTSELQSLMRISYAVFCLKKKKYTRTTYDSP